LREEGQSGKRKREGGPHGQRRRACSAEQRSVLSWQAQSGLRLGTDRGVAQRKRRECEHGPGCCSEETEGMRARTNQRMLCTAKHGCEFLGEEGKGADAGAGWHLRRDFLSHGELAHQGSAGARTRSQLMSSREPPTERGGRTWKVVRRSRCSTVARRLGVAS